MTESILRGGHYYFPRPDGSWLRYNDAAGAWEPSSPPPPPDPPPPSAFGAQAPAATAAPVTAYPENVYRGSGATAAAREIEGGAAPTYEWRTTVSSRPAEGFGAAPTSFRPVSSNAWRTPVLAIVAVALIAGAGFLGYKEFLGPETFTGHGITFQYPNGWAEETEAASVGAAFGLAWTAGFSPGGNSEELGILAGLSRGGFQGARADISRAQRAIATSLRRFAGGGGVTIGETTVTRVGDNDAVAATISGPIAGSEPIELRLFFVPHPRQSRFYLLGCVFTSSRKADAEDACNQMTTTFDLRNA